MPATLSARLLAVPGTEGDMLVAEASAPLVVGTVSCPLLAFFWAPRDEALFLSRF